MKETTKAMLRRAKEDHYGLLPWNDIFTGAGIDIGPGDDPILKPNVKLFDMKDGDANNIHEYFAPCQFDWVHSSQCLEHMRTPEAVYNWFKILRIGGHLVATVPSWEHYEGCIWPSRWNPDHKSTWSMWRKESGIKNNAPRHVYVPEFVENVCHAVGARKVAARFVDTNYDYNVGASRDQTYNFDDKVECFIEMVFQKN